MADYIVTSGELTAVANAIREKNGTSSSLSWPNGFVSGISSGGGGETWESVYSGSIEPDGELSPFTADVSLTMTATDSIKVVYDGVEYVLPKQITVDGNFYGATPGANPGDIDFSEYPFLIQVFPDIIRVYTEKAGLHTIAISVPQSGGSSDFSTAEVTVVNNYENAFMIHASSAMDNDEMHASVSDTDSSSIGNRTILQIILYKGNAVMRIGGFPLGAKPTITTSGNIQYIEIANIYTITGDCTITIS